MKFTELANNLKEVLAPVYLVEGEEAYFRAHAVKSIQSACALTQPLLNESVFDGESLKGEKLSHLRDSLFALPFLDDRRLVRVNEFYPTEKEWENVLKDYVEKPCPSTVLVICNSQKKANCADLKKKKGVTYVDCAKEGEEMLTRWLFALMRRANLNVSADLAGLIVRYCNCDAARMRLETQKLKSLLGEGGAVTREIIDQTVAKDVEYKIYELTQAASKRNFTLFYEILYDLQSKGFDEHAVLSSLLSHYKTLSELSTARGTDGEIAKAFGMKPYAVQKNRELVARMGGEKAQEIYLRLYTLSCGAKSGEYVKTGALFAAIAKILFD